MRLKYSVVGLPKEELNGREVALVAKLTEPNPNLTCGPSPSTTD
jgi:hypothetical protein